MICPSCGKDSKIAGHILADCLARQMHGDIEMVSLSDKGKHIAVSLSGLSIKGEQIWGQLEPRLTIKESQKRSTFANWDSIGMRSQWNRIRRAVYKRDANICRRCGKKNEQSNRHCHHIFGSENIISKNLADYVTLCSSCHGKMGRDFVRRLDTSVQVDMRYVPIRQFLRNAVKEMEHLPFLLTKDGVAIAIVGPYNEVGR